MPISDNLKTYVYDFYASILDIGINALLLIIVFSAAGLIKIDSF